MMASSSTEYKVGTISQILAKQSEEGDNNDGRGSSKKPDPKLAALFGSNNPSSCSKVYRTVKVTESQIFRNKKEVKEKSGDGADIKKKKKKGKSDGSDMSQKPVEAASIHTTTDDKVAKKTTTEKKLKKKLKRLKNGGDKEDDGSGLNNVPKKEKNKLDKKMKKKKKDDGNEDDSAAGAKNNQVPALAEDKKKKKKAKNLQINAVKIKKEQIDSEDDEDQPRFNNNNSSSERKTLAERNAPKPKDKELEARTIFVGNLPTDTKKKELRKMFKRFGGVVETVRLRCGAPSKPSVLKKVAINKKELHPDNNTVAAYIRFSTVDEAEKAAASACGMVFHEHHLTVDLADQGGKNKKDNKKAIFVGNLSLKLTDEELWRFFEDCGKISSVRIVRDNATGLGKGFGYVNFEEKESVATALSKKNQVELKNRAVRISRCVKKVKVKKGSNSNNSKGVAAAAVGKKRGAPPVQQQHQRVAVKKEEDKKVSSTSAGIVMKKKKFEGKKFEGKKWRNDEDGGRKKIRKNREVASEFSGDRLAEIRKLKRKSKKPNKGEMKKAKIKRMLTQTTPNRKKTFK